ncbi:hypothetical protein NXS19_001324 [Fusarium pseudograminearum]|nr:hypothetical protein NXS19_001324 [Fusarium pseudograminearum]
MSDPQERRQILEIPPQLYEKLTECQLPHVPMTADALLEWAELLSTQNFTDVILEDTSSNLVGLLRALSAFPFDDDFNAARKSVKSFSITIKDPSGKEGHPERDALGSLPVSLAQTIHGMTNLQTISLDLGPFSVEDGQKFYNAVMSSPPKPIWRNMQSIRIRGLHVLAACIMCRCDYECLVAVDVDNWVGSHPFEKMVVIDRLDRVRLYYDKDHATSPVYNELKFPSTATATWKELMRVSRRVLGIDWIALQEADCDRSNEFTQLNHVQMIQTAFMNVRAGVERIKMTRLAFHFDYRRFSPSVIRRNMGIPITNLPLNPYELGYWYEKRIIHLMRASRLREVWIFVHSSLAYVGTYDGYGDIAVQRREFGDEPKQGFPWELMEDSESNHYSP